MGDQLNITGGQTVQSYSCCVRTGIVMMEQLTRDTRSGTPFTPSLEDFRQTVVDISVSRNRLSVLKRYGGNEPNFGKKHAIICLEALLFLLNFTDGFSSGKTHITVASSRGRIGIPRFHLLLRCPNREETFIRQFFLACGCTSPPYPASALHSGYGTPKRHNVSFSQGSCEDCK